MGSVAHELLLHHDKHDLNKQMNMTLALAMLEIDFRNAFFP